MKCDRLVDWLEEHGEANMSGEWESLVAHAKTCPDCGLFLQRRAEMLETMRFLPRPAVPAGLTERIMAEVELTDRSDVEETGDGERRGWGDLLMAWLTPVEVVLAGVCLFMAMNLFFPPGRPTVDGGMAGTKSSAGTFALIPNSPPAKSLPPRPVPGESLVRLSDREVLDFMKKLEEYRRLHPEMETASPVPVPVDLAGYRGR
jgi:hypothetical protein